MRSLPQTDEVSMWFSTYKKVLSARGWCGFPWIVRALWFIIPVPSVTSTATEYMFLTV